MIQEINSNNAPAAAGPYSQAIEANGFVFLSGQIAVNSQGEFKNNNIEVEIKQVMENLQAVLSEAGLDFSAVVRTEIFITDMADYAVINSTYESFLQKPYPARFTVAVKELPKGAKVEIAMIAVK